MPWSLYNLNLPILSHRGKGTAVLQDGPCLYQLSQDAPSRTSRLGSDPAGAHGAGGQFCQPRQLQQKGLRSFLHKHPEESPFCEHASTNSAKWDHTGFTQQPTGVQLDKDALSVPRYHTQTFQLCVSKWWLIVGIHCSTKTTEEQLCGMVLKMKSMDFRCL